MSAIVSNGPFLAAFRSVLKLQGKPLAADTLECATTAVKLLIKEKTTGDRPGMLLGKVQSGKTRAFVSALALAFDNGFDIAIILTKTSTPLAVQTVRRLQRDLGPAISDNRLRIHDAKSKIPNLTDWERERKLIFVCKKHQKNLANLQEVLFDRYTDLAGKRSLIIDDEADFASVGFQRKSGSVHVRTIHTT